MQVQHCARLAGRDLSNPDVHDWLEYVVPSSAVLTADVEVRAPVRESSVRVLLTGREGGSAPIALTRRLARGCEQDITQFEQHLPLQTHNVPAWLRPPFPADEKHLAQKGIDHFGNRWSAGKARATAAGSAAMTKEEGSES